MTDADILVVDDEPALRQLLQDFLRRQGFRVRIAANGQEALTAIEQVLPRLVLLDLYMPGLDGVGVLRRLREHWPKGFPFGVIVLTSSREEPLLQASLALGAFDVLLKPVHLDQVELAVRTNLALRPGWNESASQRNPST